MSIKRKFKLNNNCSLIFISGIFKNVDRGCVCHQISFLYLTLFNRIILEEWKKADADNSNTLSLKEIVKLLDRLNLKLKTKDVKRIFTVCRRIISENCCLTLFEPFYHDTNQCQGNRR